MKSVILQMFQKLWSIFQFKPKHSPKPSDKKKAVFFGRWSPMHAGHRWLVSQKLNLGIPCLIYVRDTPRDEKNPFTAEERKSMMEAAFFGEDVQVEICPDIESVNWGRGVGYEVNEHKPPEDIKWISATRIRECIKNDDPDWLNYVDPRTAAWLKDYYRQNNNISE
jgi:FAD synthase